MLPCGLYCCDTACIGVEDHMDVAELYTIYIDCSKHLLDHAVEDKRGFLQPCEHWELAN